MRGFGLAAALALHLGARAPAAAAPLVRSDGAGGSGLELLELGSSASPGGEGGSGGSGGSGMDMPGMPMSDIDTGASAPREAKFCNGQATSMSMTGFGSVLFDERRADHDCLVFFAAIWVMDTPLKFAFGCLSAALLGVAAEALARAQQDPRVKAGALAPRLLVYTVGLIVGYLVMLLVMTLSLELGLSVIAGLAFGRGFHWYLAGNQAGKDAEGLTPC
ncbi:unnamed protein product [Prorocentrum cordatum]|uniref:Copper transport protein n=1 Tax=Prorocentrum cordatum TaxID=2364126 RepID=A0ABN9XXP2_9DINO|nr:unnamed protein product [Polarella glacialis]